MSSPQFACPYHPNESIIRVSKNPRKTPKLVYCLECLLDDDKPTSENLITLKDLINLAYEKDISGFFDKIQGPPPDNITQFISEKAKLKEQLKTALDKNIKKAEDMLDILLSQVQEFIKEVKKEMKVAMEKQLDIFEQNFKVFENEVQSSYQEKGGQAQEKSKEQFERELARKCSVPETLQGTLRDLVQKTQLEVRENVKDHKQLISEKLNTIVSYLKSKVEHSPVPTLVTKGVMFNGTYDSQQKFKQALKENACSIENKFPELLTNFDIPSDSLIIGYDKKQILDAVILDGSRRVFELITRKFEPESIRNALDDSTKNFLILAKSTKGEGYGCYLPRGQSMSRTVYSFDIQKEIVQTSKEAPHKQQIRQTEGLITFGFRSKQEIPHVNFTVFLCLGASQVKSSFSVQKSNDYNSVPTYFQMAEFEMYEVLIQDEKKPKGIFAEVDTISQDKSKSEGGKSLFGNSIQSGGLFSNLKSQESKQSTSFDDKKGTGLFGQKKEEKKENQERQPQQSKIGKSLFG